MKKIILIAVIIIAASVTLSSLTYKESRKISGYTPRTAYIIPLRPNVTVIADEYTVYKYLKKGFQIQNAWYSHNPSRNMFVLVKY
jgi:flagellar basal body-associated protein FliL